jgi:hypothetical protein
MPCGPNEKRVTGRAADSPGHPLSFLPVSVAAATDTKKKTAFALLPRANPAITAPLAMSNSERSIAQELGKSKYHE